METTLPVNNKVTLSPQLQPGIYMLTVATPARSYVSKLVID